MRWPRSSRRRRVIAGIAVAALGVVAVVAGLAKPTIALVGLGAVLVFIAVAMLVPVVARPLSGALGRPLAWLLGTPGKLGRENSMRNPRRTAQTAAALMIGLALVSTIAVLGASLSTSAKNSVDSAVSADYIVSGSGGFSKSVAPTVSRLSGVTTTTTIYQGQFEFQELALDARRGDPRQPVEDRHPPRHLGQRRSGDGRGSAAGRHQHREGQRPSRRLGGGCQIRPDRSRRR